METDGQWIGTSLEALLASERRRLVALCAGLTGDIGAAEDLAQETLTEAWRLRNRLHDPAGLSPWLSAIARNVCHRWVRKRGREALRPLDRREADRDRRPEAADSFDIEVELERAELAQLLDRALETLTTTARAVLVQRYIEEQSHAEIAERLGMTEGAVRVALHRGKLALARVLRTTFAGELGPPNTDCPDWQETRIWCPICGNHRFQGRLDTVAGTFQLRCLWCYERHGTYTEYTSSVLFQNVRGFKAAFNRIMRFNVPFHRESLSARSTSCPSCQQCEVPVHLFLPPGYHAADRVTRGTHLVCPGCNELTTMRLSNLALYQPDAWDFWRRHPRIRRLPERHVEVDGREALVFSYESVREPAAVDVVFAADTYTTLGVHVSGEH